MVHQLYQFTCGLRGTREIEMFGTYRSITRKYENMKIP